jgi:hypothetical protein
MHLAPHVTILIATTCGAGYLMTVAGLGKSLLEFRRPDRRCPSCGRQLQAGVCSTCTNA